MLLVYCFPFQFINSTEEVIIPSLTAPLKTVKCCTWHSEGEY